MDKVIQYRDPQLKNLKAYTKPVTKICHITSVHNRFDTRIFEKQCVSLANNGFDVALLCSDYQANEINSGVRILNVGPISKNTFIRILKASKVVYFPALQVNADIYQIHDPELIPLGLKLINQGKKVIYDCHEDLPQQILDKKWIPWFLRKLISKLVSTYIYNKFDKFSAVLTVTPHILEKLSKSTDRAFIVANYPVINNSIANFSFQDYLSRENKLCYSGTVYTSSLQENLLNSISAIDNIKYLIIGDLDIKMHAKLKKNSAWPKVTYIKRVPRRELNNIYNKVTIGNCILDYSPNLNYKDGSLGVNKIYEYMQFGIPIVCTDFTLWKEIVDIYNCGIYVNPHDIYAIRKALVYLMTHKFEAYTMGQNGKRAISEVYNWNTQEKIYLNIIDNIMELNERGPGNIR